MPVDLVVEGDTDEFVVRRILREMGLEVGTVYGKRGIDALRRSVRGWVERGRYGYKVLVVADARDLGSGCLGPLRAGLVPNENDGCVVRLAVPDIEAWVMASRTNLARYLRIPVARLPLNPDVIPNGKIHLINAARASRSPGIRMAMVPMEGASIAPGYVSTVGEFMSRHWDWAEAVERSSSLARASAEIRGLAT